MNEQAQNRKMVYIPVEKIFPHPDNPRKDLGDLTELADSIRHSGVMQNLTVVSNRISQAEYEKILDACDGKPAEYQRHMLNHGLEDSYTVVIGHRRLAAARLAGLGEAPCVVVDMSYQEQVATMMTENLQRVDLTPYEQAQGFRQLTVDFGMSVEDVAEKTGFSSSTVRRRLKLCDLNGDIFRRVTDDAHRQISMGDLDRLSEIENEKTRNIVLADIGTKNFENSLRKALDAQEKARNAAKWRAALAGREGFTEIKDLYQPGYVTEKYVSLMNDPVILNGLTGGPYFWTILGETLYIKKKSPYQAQRDKEEAAREAEGQKRKEAYKRVKEAFRRAYAMRKAFIERMGEKEAKAHLLDALVMAYESFRCARDDFYILNEFCFLNGYSDDELSDVMDETDGYPDWSDIASRTKAGKGKIILYWLYACCCDGPMDCTCKQTWNDACGTYQTDERTDYDRLTVIYRGLERMGYQMSDEEAALMDGSSELYYRAPEEKQEPGTEPEEPEEPAAQEEPDESEKAKTAEKKVRTRFEAFKAMGIDELERGIGDNDNARGDMKNAILDCNTAEEVAVAVEPWFCSQTGCVDGESCRECIENWLNEPYEEEESDKGGER